MNDDWAVDQLQAIRTLMERSALYRRALAPVLTVAGVIICKNNGLPMKYHV